MKQRSFTDLQLEQYRKPSRISLKLEKIDVLVDWQTIVERIFAEDDKTVYEAEPAAFECGCSDERTLAMLASLDEAELGEIVEAEESVVVGCDFCGQQYSHDAATIAALLSNKIHPN